MKRLTKWLISRSSENGKKPVTAGLLDKHLKDKNKGVSVEEMNEASKGSDSDFRNAPSRN